MIEHQGPWRDFDEVERAVFQWVAWYNSERLHSALGYIPPDEYEQAYWASLEPVPQTAWSHDRGLHETRDSSPPRHP
ncbi:integrase core domain-containing protein [Kitasatospora sp. NPDC017646]|uniref:integrase core domain-containing protein n=1 Tax=Kitasatospora sp. NPDC017646 TaxID=3364024 RepID=UPI00379F6BC2